uniref:Gamma-aminobutyric acid receptor subunit beta n=1 Tax=Cupiennius salei TaxID=6928 RepID=T1E1T2_CUPSA
MNLWTQLVVFLMAVLSCAWADKVLLLEQKILNDIFTNYDKRVRPYGKNGTGPVVVEINTFVRSLNDLDDVKMVYTAQLTFRQKWQDDRLKYEKQGLEFVTLTSADRMWIPDLFFSNEMRGHFHKILTPNNLVRIYPDGHVLYSTRVSLELFCPMNLKNYPMDKQECDIKAASYGYTTNDIVFEWKPMDPVQLAKKLYLPKFSLNDFRADYCTSKTNTGEYSCVVLKLHFSREFTFYLLQAFMPTMSLVILSWITFWLHPRSVATRLGIWIGVLLSLIIVTTSVAESGPRVSYIKAIDVWMGTCICFIFCVLIEMGLVNNAVTKDDRRNMKSAEDAEKSMCVDDGVKSNSNRPPNYTATPLRWLNKYSTQAQRIDAVSRFLFPASFAFFNFVYWLTYTAK